MKVQLPEWIAQQTFTNPEASYPSSQSYILTLSQLLFSLFHSLQKSTYKNALENPTVLAQSWRACGKLFQLANLTRLEIIQDPKTTPFTQTHTPHGFFEVDLKGKLISQMYRTPGLCSPQETLFGVISGKRGWCPRQILEFCLFGLCIKSHMDQ